MKKEKEKLLVLELWGLGDLAMVHDFIKTASGRFQVTLIAKPHAETVCRRFWPEVELVPFTAPWTAFRGKYKLWRWPWRSMREMFAGLRSERFDAAVSARMDPRDHWVMWRSGARRRIGFPKAGGGLLLTDRLSFPKGLRHRYEHWRDIAVSLGLEMPLFGDFQRKRMAAANSRIVMHTGAARDTRVWPLQRYLELAKRLRSAGREVDLLCDERQRARLEELGEAAPIVPASIEELLQRLEVSSAFVGNDSGPGHWAAVMGVPTFTVYGPVTPRMFGPLHSMATAVEGAPCPHKPCYDTCRYSVNRCMEDVDVDQVWGALEGFLERIQSS